MQRNIIYSPVAVSIFVASQVMLAQLSEPVSLSGGWLETENISNSQQDYCTPVEYDVIESFKTRLLAISKLQGNWDGYGAVEPLAEVVNNALAFVDAIPEYFLSHLDSEDVMPTPHGTINFDWYYGDDYLCVEIGKSNIGYFSEIDGRKIATKANTRVTNSDLSAIINSLTTLYSEDLVDA